MPDDAQVDDLFREVTELFANRRVEQLMLRFEANTKNWDDFKETNNGKFSVSSLARLLRMGSLFYYIRKLNKFNNSRKL